MWKPRLKMNGGEDSCPELVQFRAYSFLKVCIRLILSLCSHHILSFAAVMWFVWHTPTAVTQIRGFTHYKVHNENGKPNFVTYMAAFLCIFHIIPQRHWCSHRGHKKTTVKTQIFFKSYLQHLMLTACIFRLLVKANLILLNQNLQQMQK